MKRYILLFPVCFLLLGCPVYDPPHGSIKVHNSSKDAIYIYSDCADTLSLSYPLKLFIVPDNTYDEKGNKMTDTIFPDRIDPDSIREVSVWGTPTKPKIVCDDKKIRLFLLKRKY